MSPAFFDSQKSNSQSEKNARLYIGRSLPVASQVRIPLVADQSDGSKVKSMLGYSVGHA